jgi:hypothetical protein
MRLRRDVQIVASLLACAYALILALLASGDCMILPLEVVTLLTDTLAQCSSGYLPTSINSDMEKWDTFADNSRCCPFPLQSAAT